MITYNEAEECIEMDFEDLRDLYDMASRARSYTRTKRDEELLEESDEILKEVYGE